MTSQAAHLLHDWHERLARADADAHDLGNPRPWLARMHARILRFLLERYRGIAPAREGVGGSDGADVSGAEVHPDAASRAPEFAQITPEQRLEIDRRSHLLYAPPLPPPPAHGRVRKRETLGKYLREIGNENRKSGEDRWVW